MTPHSHLFLLFASADDPALVAHAARVAECARDFARTAIAVRGSIDATMKKTLAQTTPYLWEIADVATPGQALIGMLNVLIPWCLAEKITTVTILDSHTAPLMRAHFQNFLTEFVASRAPYTFCATQAKGVIPQLAGMTWNIAEFATLDWLPLQHNAWVEQWSDHDPAYELLRALNAKDWRWQYRARQLSWMTFGEQQLRMHAPWGLARIDGYCPEASCVTSHDAEFWNNFAQWQK